MRILLHSGVPEVVRMRIIGHRTRAMVDRNNILSHDDVPDAMRKMATEHNGGNLAR